LLIEKINATVICVDAKFNGFYLVVLMAFLAASPILMSFGLTSCALLFISQGEFLKTVACFKFQKEVS
jgi:hypothetical protein